MAKKSRKRLEEMSLKDLKALKTEVSDVIQEVENRPYPRDIDIALNFHGENSLVAELVYTCNTNSPDRWNNIQKIYCCEEHCERCPHGPFTFSYKRFKNGKIRVKFQGRPVFDPIALQAAFKRPKNVIR